MSRQMLVPLRLLALSTDPVFGQVGEIYINTVTKNLRVQLSPGFGSYMIANYASENKNLRWIYEGYMGIKTSKKGTDWIDIGVFSSPYTYEFAKSWEQVLFTRSLAPEYVPYYLLGLRYKRKINTNLSLTTFLLNGWQHLEIQRKIPSLGTQLEYTKKKNYINWTSYQGNEKNVAQPNFGYRFFTEMSWIYTTNKFKLFACGYTGMQLISGQAKFWGQVHFAGEFQLIKKLLVNARIEQFCDPNNIQIRQGSNHGFNCSGISLGLHTKVTDFLFLFEINCASCNASLSSARGRYERIAKYSPDILKNSVKFFTC